MKRFYEESFRSIVQDKTDGINENADLLQVSRRWYQVANDPLLWFQLVHKSGLPCQPEAKLPSALSVTCQENACGELSSGTLNTGPSSVDDSTFEINWKSVYRTTLETQCNWRNGSPWAPVILPAHHNHVITCLEVYNDWAITGSDDASICIWNLVTNQLIISLFGHLGGVWSLVVIPPLPAPSLANKLTDIHLLPLLVSGSCDRSARVWLLDGLHWPCITTLYGHQSTVRCVAGQESSIDPSTLQCQSCGKVNECEQGLEFNRNDSISGDFGASVHARSDIEGLRLVVTGSRDTTLRLWDAQTGRCIYVFQGHVVVSGSYDCTIRLWCIHTGQCLRVLHGHRNRVYTILFDGRHIISASLDTTIRVWDAPTGQLEHTFCGHQSLTSEMAYEASQQLLVSSNADETIRVWDVASGECVHVLAGIISTDESTLGSVLMLRELTN
ncbi:F-box and WD-40 domain protein 7 [Fasciolopsis buskii]|uniref:F-box and WD-40 domain protein 7 n=1 Tax=Fasciolopsis buskii TaxID=27845 RepID=A0A8E0RZW1_9TREM|nr:F-box and WD-40 domain protein 7 [Fasciolopsis buski]